MYKYTMILFVLCFVTVSLQQQQDPALEQTCSLPPAVGPCRGSFIRWYFNAKDSKCYEFIYGGCGGNNNNFATREKCHQYCALRKTDG